MALRPRPARYLLPTLAMLTLLSAFPGSGAAEDNQDSWLAYRANASRTAYQSVSLDANLATVWTYQSTHAPRPAWPRSERMPFDRAQHTVVSDGKVFFGSSVDGRVMALEFPQGNTGRWGRGTRLVRVATIA